MCALIIHAPSPVSFVAMRLTAPPPTSAFGMNLPCKNILWQAIGKAVSFWFIAEIIQNCCMTPLNKCKIPVIDSSGTPYFAPSHISSELKLIIKEMYNQS